MHRTGVHDAVQSILLTTSKEDANECCARGERVDDVGGRGWCGEVKQHVPRELDVKHREQQPAYARESATTNSQRHHGQEHHLSGRAHTAMIVSDEGKNKLWHFISV